MNADNRAASSRSEGMPQTFLPLGRDTWALSSAGDSALTGPRPAQAGSALWRTTTTGAVSASRNAR